MTTVWLLLYYDTYDCDNTAVYATRDLGLAQRPKGWSEWSTDEDGDFICSNPDHPGTFYMLREETVQT